MTARAIAKPAATAVAYFDGGSRGNPGLAGYGVHIVCADGREETFGDALPRATCNEAEYEGLIAALGWMVARGVTHATVRSDSMLVVQQMTGRYRVKQPHLQRLKDRAVTLVRQMRAVTFEHVPRRENARCDYLANEAMNRACVRPTPARSTEPHSEAEKLLLDIMASTFDDTVSQKIWNYFHKNPI